MHVNGVMSVSLKKAGIWSNIGQQEEDTEVYDKVHHCFAVLNHNFSAILKHLACTGGHA